MIIWILYFPKKRDCLSQISFFLCSSFLYFKFWWFVNFFYIDYDVGERRWDMLNQVVLVGRIVYDLELKKSDALKKYLTLTLAIPRSFKNMEGSYDTDFIKCIVWDNIAENTSLYCHKGDIVGVKGRLQSRSVKKNDKKEIVMEVVGEKVTFLTSKSSEENN